MFLPGNCNFLLYFCQEYTYFYGKKILKKFFFLSIVCPET